MNENRKQILEMLSAGKVTAEEAEKLIAALEKNTLSENLGNSGEIKKPKYLRIVVESDDAQYGSGPTKVNIKVPMQLLRAGVKLAGLIPIQARDHVNAALKEHGVQVDLSQLKPENLEELVDHLNDLTVDVDEKSNKVRIFCE
jgi:hypothetical protein